MTEVVHLLVGLESKHARAAAEVTRTTITTAGYTCEDIANTGMTNTAAARRTERLLAVGGDGVFHIALQSVADTDTVLGVVPAGTGNDFARTFGLCDIAVEQAAARALGPYHLVDAIRVEPTSTRPQPVWAGTSVTGGFSVDVNNRAEHLRFVSGSSRYTLATMLTLFKLRRRRLAFTVDGQRHEFNTVLWAVANTPTFGGGMAICPDADPSDGLLDLTVVADVGWFTLARLLYTVFAGSHVHRREVHTFKGQQITVEDVERDASDIAYEVQADGERLGVAPVTLTAVRSTVRLAADLGSR